MSYLGQEKFVWCHPNRVLHSSRANAAVAFEHLTAGVSGRGCYRFARPRGGFLASREINLCRLARRCIARRYRLTERYCIFW